MKDKADLGVLAATNLAAWIASPEAEPMLKNVLMIVSIGYALHRWLYWARNKKNTKANDE